MQLYDCIKNISKQKIYLNDNDFRRVKLLDTNLHFVKEFNGTIHFFEGSSCGGPIAVLLNDGSHNQGDTCISNTSKSTKLIIFTPLGLILSSHIWKYDIPKCIKWTNDSILICIFRNGMIRFFSVQGDLIISMHGEGKIKSSDEVIICDINSKLSSIILLYKYNFITLVSYFPLKTKKLCEMPSHLTPLACCICPPCLLSNSLCVIVSFTTGSLYLINEKTSIELPRKNEPFDNIKLSPSCDYLALQSLTKDVFVYDINSEFTTVYKVFSPPPNNQSLNINFLWLGSDTIVFVSETKNPTKGLNLKIFEFENTEGTIVKQTFNDTLVLPISEIDGLRIYCYDEIWLIEKMEQCTKNILNLSFSSPGALLYFSSFDNSMILSNILKLEFASSYILTAINECIDCANIENDHELCQSLLNASRLGRHFLPFLQYHSSNATNDIDSISKQTVNIEMERRILLLRYLKACRNRRMINVMREKPLHIVITEKELYSVGIQTLVQNLLNRKLYSLAFRLALSFNLTDYSITNRKGIIWNTYSTLEFVQLKVTNRNIRSSIEEVIDNKVTKNTFFTSDILDPVICVGDYIVINKLQNLHQQILIPRGNSILSYIIENWIVSMISNSEVFNDSQILKQVVTVLLKFPVVLIHFVEIAIIAANYSRIELAKHLIQFEQNTQYEIKVLISLHEINLALKKAIISGSPDLIYECLYFIEKECLDSIENISNLFLLVIKILIDYPILKYLFQIISLRNHNIKWLLEMYETGGDLREAYFVSLYKVLSSNNEEHQHLLAHAAAFLGSSNDNSIYCSRIVQNLTLEHIELISYNQNLHKENNEFGVNTKMKKITLLNTLKNSFNTKTAEFHNLSKQFNVSSKRIIRLRFMGLAENGLFDEMEAFIQDDSHLRILVEFDFIFIVLDAISEHKKIEYLLSRIKKRFHKNTFTANILYTKMNE